MRTILHIDDALLAQALALAGPMEKAALLREALTALIQRESARKLARMDGSEPDLQDLPRWRAEVA